jgi:membrane-associated protease RseP (regulator of RpoE activity)
VLGAATVGGAILLSLVLHLIFTTVAARAARIEMKRARLFLGPKVLGFTALGVPFELGAIPLGSFVEFVPTDADDPSRTSYDVASRGRRILVSLVPWLLVLGVALGFAGLEALFSFARGFSQVFMGLLVFSEGPLLVGRIVDTVRTAPPLLLVGLVLSKLAAFNLLPFPGLSGGRAFEALVDRRLPLWLSLGPLACAIGWAISVFFHLRAAP